MVIKGKKNYLRTKREKDLDALYELACDFEARGPYYPVSIPAETTFKQRFQENGSWSNDYGALLICNLADDEILGEISHFKAAPYFDGFEIAYRLYDSGQSRRGIMTEALILFTYVLFTTKKINRLELKIIPENIPSKRVAEKCGYQLEGVNRGAIFHRGAYRDMEVHSILRDEAPARLEDVLDRINL
ncbi:MAG: GNAT family N-acetyltransferase [Candidatus Latescibacteria bacterium]|nr:GNAT family N-acetyltransferase [Candidatus Latescibacterota bacterium]